MEKKAGGVRTRLTKDQLLAALKTRREEFELAGVGTIIIESISVDRYAAAQGDLGEMSSTDALKRICLLGVVEPTLAPDDLEALGKADVGLVNEIANRIMRLSGLIGGDTSRFLTPTKEQKGSSSIA